jgi:hypothetical protein
MMDAASSLSDQVRQGLSDLLGTAPFQDAPTLSALLRFLVEEEISGRGAALCAHRIAHAGLGLPETFDPICNPTVRVQVGRLRRTLDKAYREGCEATLRISVPRSSYRPIFART